MKYIALLSGGKDSCYNLLHCAKNGHELVAAASLGPGQGKEEIDSYLYQTVGQDAIQFVAQALDVPLYRRIISGDAVEQGNEYGGRNSKAGVQGDETEDLYELLSDVKSHHPDIQGVSVGAILSNYQRVRVEHVCRRLSLTCLCYLWQRPQDELLAEMIEAGMEAVLIKVAGIGLTAKHLGKTLGEMQSTFTKLNSLYGAHICGEGGEYETLTLDCPLFKSRIVLTEVETVIHSDHDFATVAFLRVKNATLVAKPNPPSFDVYVPSILNGVSTAVRDAVLESQNIPDTEAHRTQAIDSSSESQDLSCRKIGPWVAVTNIQACSQRDVEYTIEDEVKECFRILHESLSKFSLDLTHCTNINIFLSSIELFARVNAVYATFFGTSPPARACVAIDLPGSTNVKLDCMAYTELGPTSRQALHVQSLSYWAPANIGPYSQSITVDQRIFMSGQIGMIPSTLSLPSPQSLATETALSIQHVDQITDVLRSNSGGGWVGHTQVALYWLANVGDLPHVKKAHHAYRNTQDYPEAPTLFLVVKSLPKDALVEKQVLLHTGRCLIRDEDDGEVSLEPRVPIFERNEIKLGEAGMLEWQTSRFEENTSSYTICCVRGGGGQTQEMLQELGVLVSHSPRTISVRVFHVPSKNSPVLEMVKGLYGTASPPPIISIRCRSISTKGNDDWDYAICALTI